MRVSSFSILHFDFYLHASWVNQLNNGKNVFRAPPPSHLARFLSTPSPTRSPPYLHGG